MIHYWFRMRFQNEQSSLYVPQVINLLWHWSHLVQSPQDALFQLIANSILGATILSTAVKPAFCIPSSIVSTILLTSLSTNSLEQLSQVFAFTKISSVVKFLTEVPTVEPRPLVPSFTIIIYCPSLALLPKMISWSRSIIELRILLFDCLFL